MALRGWRIFAENHWRTFGENEWRSVGENIWRTLGENAWRIIARKLTAKFWALAQVRLVGCKFKPIYIINL